MTVVVRRSGDEASTLDDTDHHLPDCDVDGSKSDFRARREDDITGARKNSKAISARNSLSARLYLVSYLPRQFCNYEVLYWFDVFDEKQLRFLRT